MAEIINNAELAELVAATPVTDDHQALLDALADRYPESRFRLIQERTGCSWAPGIIDAAGNQVTDNLGQWVDQELAATGGDARAVWDRYKHSGLIRTERVGGALFLTAPFGTDPDAFLQLEILVGAVVATQHLFDPSSMFPPEDRFDLISGSSIVFADEDRQVLAPAAYQFRELVNIRRFLRDLVEVEKANRLAEMPDIEKKMVHVQDIVIGEPGGQTSYDIPFLDMCPGWLDRVPPAARFFQDWQESSAGKTGHRLCDHWWIQTSDYTDQKGRRRLSIIPQWAEADGGLDLPEIYPDWDRDTPYGVMDKLQRFDKQAGYPFAWYFYMLHGNRVGCAAGGIIANAIKEGVLNLPPHDEKILLRWRDEQYGF